jgi:hypothetical protein
MTGYRAANWLLAAIIAAAMSTAYLLDAPTEAQARIDTARSAQDAQKHAQREARFERAARKLCGGDNSVFELLEDGAIQCLTKRGFPTITAKVAL